ncbi:Nuclear nucleic acid-binding protein C1D-like [Oopsacas minuta]|uniref:Nuclear nucleic acid-binding protein C1D n=1 Tax=Oopsacas minuta TaxID=111878 RepID=A0AAV7K6Y1_9METZ|nr:Nuclear nucleic acid-binding protein C1D-like [Oopsacas minuta]
MSKQTDKLSGKRNRSNSETGDESLPPEIEDSCEKFFRQLVALEKVLQPLFSTDITQLEQSLTSEQQTALKLLQLYGINSLFFSYVTLSGEDPEGHEIQHELARIEKYINQVKEIGDRSKRPKIDKPAVKRFVKAGIGKVKKTKRK